MSQLIHRPRKRTFYSCDFKADLLQTIRQLPSTLTTSELISKGTLYTDDDHPPSALHEYLCSSPHLLHLKAPKTCNPIAHMDLHGRLIKLLARPGMNRKTLHIRIFSPDRHNVVVPEPYSEFARVAFGYIARVCPDLRDLTLGNGKFLPNAYQHLERIEIERFTERAALSPPNFEWMHEFGQTEVKKAERRELLEEYEIDEPFDPELREELRYLVWPVEVQNFFGALDKPVTKNGVSSGGGGFECLPALRYSCICSPSGFDLPPEQDYKCFIANASFTTYY
ncbi:hypothetical protein BG015_007381 [Linnemannia schmuckeri]|uniref:Uncharacterized protein n=1 Tax=Linnemannia schmuckeri TaxID=64567 RepID=A0A9P5S640_9FUNG|nr:hypothetical protein BG015_007381 [Linnemannia schmuckeri]